MVAVEDFLTLAGQLFFILCIQSILEMMISTRRQSQLLKPISIGCYIASLLLVLHFMEKYVSGILKSIQNIF